MILAYQQIIIDKIGNKCFEEISIKADEENFKMTKLSSAPPTMITPKSVNYEISLNKAVLQFLRESKPVAA